MLKIRWYNVWFYRRVRDFMWRELERMQAEPMNLYSDDDFGYALHDDLETAIYLYERGAHA
jgi:hypothetical protein